MRFAVLGVAFQVCGILAAPKTSAAILKGIDDVAASYYVPPLVKNPVSGFECRTEIVDLDVTDVPEGSPAAGLRLCSSHFWQ